MRKMKMREPVSPVTLNGVELQPDERLDGSDKNIYIADYPIRKEHIMLLSCQKAGYVYKE